jgi:hypothetical protein
MNELKIVIQMNNGENYRAEIEANTLEEAIDIIFAKGINSVYRFEKSNMAILVRNICTFKLVKE